MMNTDDRADAVRNVRPQFWLYKARLHSASGCDGEVGRISRDRERDRRDPARLGATGTTSQGTPSTIGGRARRVSATRQLARWDNVMCLCRPEYLPKTRARDGSSGTDTRARRLDTLLSRGNLARGHNQLEGQRRCAKRAGGPGRKRAGLTRGNLARLETGRHEPTRPTLRKLATAFQVKVARPDPPRVNETSNTPPPKAAPGGVARQERNAMIPTRSIFTPAEHARLRETAR